MVNLFNQLQQESEGYDTGDESSSSEITQDFAAEIEVEVASVHELITTSQVNTNLFIQANHT